MGKRKRNRGGAKGIASAPASAVSLSSWDHGATGPANRHNLITEERGHMDEKTGKMVNPNGITGVKRLSMAQLYERRGLLTARQSAAAYRLLTAWEQKDRSPPAIQVAKVDHSPKPDDRTAMLVDRQMNYIKEARHVPRSHAKIINWVARDDQRLSAMPGIKFKAGIEALRVGLDMMADSMGL